MLAYDRWTISLAEFGCLVVVGPDILEDPRRLDRIVLMP